MAVELIRKAVIDLIEKLFRNYVLLPRIHEAPDNSRCQRLAQQTITRRMSILASLASLEDGVLSLSNDGFTSKTIVRKLSLSPRTVETHRTNLHRRFGADSVISLARLLPADCPDSDTP